MTTSPTPPGPSSPSAPAAGAARRRRLGELLVTAKLISPEQRNKALDEARRHKMRLGQYLVLQKVIKEIHLVKAISFQLKVQMYTPAKHPLDGAVREVLSRAFAVQGNLCPVFRAGDVLHVAMLDPTDMHTVDEIVFATGLDVEPLICTRGQLDELQAALYGVASPAGATIPAVTAAVPTVGLELKEPIDLDAVQRPGAFASPQGLASNRMTGSRPAAPPSVPDILEIDDVALTRDLSTTPAAAGDTQPSLELGATGGGEDAIPYVDVLAMEDAAPSETAPGETSHGDTAGAPPDILVRDAFLTRRIQAVAGVKYERAEVVRAALMLGLAVLEEEPGLVAALNPHTRDPWR